MNTNFRLLFLVFIAVAQSHATSRDKCYYYRLGKCRTLWGEHEQAIECTYVLNCCTDLSLCRGIGSITTSRSI